MLQLRDPDAEFRVQSLQRFAQGGRWKTESMRSYKRPVILWFTRGQGKITVSGTTRGFGANNAVYIPPNTMHGFSLMGPVQGTVLFLPSTVAQEFPEVPGHLRLRRQAEQAELSALIDAIDREAREDRPARDRAMLHHAGLLAVWLERHADLAEAPQDERAAGRLANAFTALVERDFRSGASVSDYAALLGVTPTHLTRACRTTCGRSASRILADRVHYEARRLLRDTDLPVSEIGRRLGFRSAAYFTRAFQTNTGATPTSFRSGNA